MDNSERKIEIKKLAEKIVENKNENVELEKEGMSTSMTKNVSDEIESPPNKKAKKSLKFGGWLPDCLDWFKRPELAQSALSISSYIMNRYCWPNLHGKVKPHTVQKLEFLEKDDAEGNAEYILEKDGEIVIPIADINPPDYITEFEEIIFRFFNDRALQFVQKILQLLTEDLTISYRQKFDKNLQIDAIKSLMTLLAPKTNELGIYANDYYFDFIKFNDQFPGFINGIQSIGIHICTESMVDLLLEWLNAQREEDKPKMLEILHCQSTLFDRVKTQFSNSIKSANFMIIIHREYAFYDCDDGEELTEVLTNENTGEILELYCRNDASQITFVRHKKDGGTQTRMEWKNQFERKSKTTIYIKPYQEWDCGYSF